MERVKKPTQIWHLGDHVGFELNDGSVVSFSHGKVEDGLLDLLYDASVKLGRVPSFEEVLENPKMPHPNTYAPYFGSFAKAVAKVEDRLGRMKREEEKNDSDELSGGEYMKRRKWTKGEIIAIVMRKEMEFGHFPTQRDFNNDPDLPNYQTIANKFGGIYDLRGEVEDKKKRMRKADSEVETATAKIMSLIAPVGSGMTGEEKDEVSSIDAVAQEDCSNEGETELMKEKNDGAIEEGANNSLEGGCEDKDDIMDSPTRACFEIKDSETGRTMRIVIALEISFLK